MQNTPAQGRFQNNLEEKDKLKGEGFKMLKKRWVEAKKSLKDIFDEGMFFKCYLLKGKQQKFWTF